MRQRLTTSLSRKSESHVKNAYRIVDDFQVETTDIRVLVLDRDYDLTIPLSKEVAVIDGKEYPFELNSIRHWAIIKSHDSFTGKTVEFI